MNDTDATSTAESTNDPVDTRPGYSPYKLGFGIGSVLVLASIFLLLAFFSLWFGRQILDTHQWTTTSTEVIEKPAVRNALANYLVDQLFESVDVEQELKNELPEQWDVLASPAASGLRSLALSGTKQALDLPVVQTAWKSANELTHEQLIAILEGGNEKVSTENGTVTINARAILADVADKVGLGESLVSKIPADAGNFVVYQSDDLATIQTAYKVAKDLRYVFAGLALLLYVLAIWLAKGRRRRAVAWMGGSMTVVGLLILIAQSLGRGPTVDTLAQTSAVVPAVTDIYNIATELLVRMATSLTFTGVVVLLATLLAGPYRWAIAFRKFLAPYLRDQVWLAAAAAALLFLILVWISPVAGFRTTVGLLINTGLAIAGFIALTLITRREFPDAEPADFGSAGEWFTRQWNTTRTFVTEKTRDIDLPSFGGADDKTTEVSRVAVDDAAKSGGADPDAGTSNIDKLERLTKLHDSGALTDAEFEAAKKQIL
ncbi:MAG: SHOCT domain-containing protein [Solirubrobacterales bacterium]